MWRRWIKSLAGRPRAGRRATGRSSNVGTRLIGPRRLDEAVQLSSSQYGQTMPHPSWFSSVRGKRWPHPRHVCRAASGTAVPSGTGPPVPVPDRRRHRGTPGGDVLDEQSMGGVRLARFREPVAAVVAGPLACRGVRTVGGGRVGARISAGCHTGQFGRRSVAVAARFPDFQRTPGQPIHDVDTDSWGGCASSAGRRSRQITPPAGVGRAGTSSSGRRVAVAPGHPETPLQRLSRSGAHLSGYETS